jgi:hypothetical protein
MMAKMGRPFKHLRCETVSAADLSGEQLAKFYKGQIAVLEARLAALDWTPITADNLPRLEDEVRDERFRSIKLVAEHMKGWDAEDWAMEGFTHRRPLNAPTAHPCGKA